MFFGHYYLSGFWQIVQEVRVVVTNNKQEGVHFSAGNSPVSEPLLDLRPSMQKFTRHVDNLQKKIVNQEGTELVLEYEWHLKLSHFEERRHLHFTCSFCCRIV